MRLRKRTVDRVIKDCFWEGFEAGLGDHRGALEYASTSGLYPYNGVRDVAFRAGYDEAQRVIDAAIARREYKARGQRVPPASGYSYEIPGEVYARCYGEAQIGLKVSPRPR